MDAFETYINDHGADLHIHMEVIGKEKDVENFERYYDRQHGLYQEEDADPDVVFYPNGRYQ